MSLSLDIIAMSYWRLRVTIQVMLRRHSQQLCRINYQMEAGPQQSPGRVCGPVTSMILTVRLEADGMGEARCLW